MLQRLGMQLVRKCNRTTFIMSSPRVASNASNAASERHRSPSFACCSAIYAPLIQPPPELTLATTPEALAILLPSSYPIAAFRRRSIEARGIRVSYKPHPGEVLGQPTPSSVGAGTGEVPVRAPSDSYLEVVLPFASSPKLRDEYTRFMSGRVRLGLVLEDIDSLAADVAARHLAGAPQSFSVVTASMDKLQLVTHEQHVEQLRMGVCAGASNDGSPEQNGSAAEAGTGDVWAACQQDPPVLDEHMRQELQRAIVEAPGDQASGGPLLIDNDLRLAGCVTFVGRSSLEVTLELADRPPPQSDGASSQGEAGGLPGGATGGGWRRRGVAHFILVARGSDPKGPLRLNPLQPVTPEAEELCRQAAQRQEERRQKRAADAAAASGQLGATPEADIALLLQLVARAKQHQAEQWQPQGLGSSTKGVTDGGEEGEEALAAVPMGSTSLQAPVLMHHQDRNITNAIFGGHILRSAYEAAYATAALHTGCHPEPLSMSDITFKQPVTVGSIVEFDAKVVLTHGDLMRVSVQAIKHEPAQAGVGGGSRHKVHQALTTTFSFLFAAPPGAVVPPVRPDSLEDAADWLLAARQHAEDGYPPPPIHAWGEALRPKM